MNPALSDMAREAATSEWLLYGRYLELRAQGLRRPAMAVLSDFIADAVNWPFERRRDFMHWLAGKLANVEIWGELLPGNLVRDLLTATAREWRSRKPDHP